MINTLKNKDRIAYDLLTTIYVVVYGVSGHQNNLDYGVWDSVYYIKNNAVKFEANIDMNKKNIINVENLSMNILSMNKFIDMNKGEIKNLGDGNENGEAPNVKQLNEMETSITKYVKE